MKLQIIAVICGFIGVSYGMVADLYLNKDKFGEYFKLEINEKGCTNVPLNWENQAVSLDTHGSCLKFYDLPYCRGKYVALQPYHGTFQDNLQTVGFSKIISSASPCGPKVPTGRYYVQNGADGSVLTIETRNNSPIARTYQFKPFISKGQQFQIERVSLADYEIIPRVHQKMNPVTFDMSTSTTSHPVKRTWKIESVYRGRYLIKNEWSNRCLYKSETGKVEEHECVAWSPNQEWIFRSIKVKPFFPSKEELKKKPLSPDDGFPFEPQEDAFSPVPYNPAAIGNRRPALPPGTQKRPNGKKPIQVQRPGPLVINPGEPFPPVFPYPILPNSNKNRNKDKRGPAKPPVPHVRHPGPLPFPSVPIVTDPKNPILFSPFDTYNVFAPNRTQNTKSKVNGEEDLNEENEESLEEQDEQDDEKKSDEEQEGQDDIEDRPNRETQGQREEYEEDSNEREEEGSEEQGQQRYEQDLQESGERNEGGYGSNEFSELERGPQNGRDKPRKPDSAKYSDYRLYF